MSRRNVTLDSSLFNILDLPFSFSFGGSSAGAFSLPFLVDEWVLSRAKSSASGGGGLVRDLVAVLNVCSSDERIRLKGFEDDSGLVDRVDEDAAGGCDATR